MSSSRAGGPAASTGAGQSTTTEPAPPPLASSVPSTSAPATTTPARAGGGARDGVPSFTHVFVVLMENLGFDSALGTAGFASLGQRFAIATRWYAAGHPSLPNYLALTSGGTWGVTSDCVDCFVDEPDVGQQLSAAGISWAAYMEGVPAPCFLADYGGADYAAKHDPFRYYVAVRSSPALCARIRPFEELPPLLRGPAAAVPRFVWVTPNLCHDGHDCSPDEAAAFLDGLVSEITSSRAWRDHGLLVVTWDEGNGGDSSTLNASGGVAPCCGGGHVLAIVAAPGVAAGERVAVPYDHYSLLATVEDAFRLPLLGAAAHATPLGAFFRH